MKITYGNEIILLTLKYDLKNYTEVRLQLLWSITISRASCTNIVTCYIKWAFRYVIHKRHNTYLVLQPPFPPVSESEVISSSLPELDELFVVSATGSMTPASSPPSRLARSWPLFFTMTLCFCSTLIRVTELLVGGTIHKLD